MFFVRVKIDQSALAIGDNHAVFDNMFSGFNGGRKSNSIIFQRTGLASTATTKSALKR
jgi:hypothetical protein